MRRLRRAKIVATLGPASSNADMIAQLFKAGADVFRINMSHTTQDRMRELVGMIRAVERDTGRPIGVLIDLEARNFVSVRSLAALRPSKPVTRSCWTPTPRPEMPSEPTCRIRKFLPPSSRPTRY